MELEKKTYDDLFAWARDELISAGIKEKFQLKPLREEASLRKYFRLETPSKSLILVDSASEKDKCKSFNNLSKIFSRGGVNVPSVHSYNKEKGYMLIEDYGDNLYQDILNRSNENKLYDLAFNQLVKLHKTEISGLKYFDKDLALDQVALFEIWFLEKYLSFGLDYSQREKIRNSYEFILSGFFSQPQVTCHFDFESRNLMSLSNGETGILDFQDAIIGPIFLDPASLIRDLYQDRDEENERNLLDIYINKALHEGLLDPKTSSDWIFWFDMACIQRQLRILGTLVRLHLRDKKSFRLVDLPKTLEYLITSSSKYKELSDLVILLNKASSLLEKEMERLS
ncbi:MAG: aminoglycoside phosphotransferase family protein [Gammaproteobacteria bacterium]